MESNFASRLNKGGTNDRKDSFQTRGARIMELSEQLRPMISEWLMGCKNAEGMPVQPAQIRAIALNVAQDLVKKAA